MSLTEWGGTAFVRLLIKSLNHEAWNTPHAKFNTVGGFAATAFLGLVSPVCYVANVSKF